MSVLTQTQFKIMKAIDADQDIFSISRQAARIARSLHNRKLVFFDKEKRHGRALTKDGLASLCLHTCS